MNDYISLAPWCGCKNVMFGYYNDYADPDLLYKGYTFNYWDVDDGMRENFASDCSDDLDELTDSEVEEMYDKYVRENAESYLDELIANGYFPNGSKSWHDKM